MYAFSCCQKNWPYSFLLNQPTRELHSKYITHVQQQRHESSTVTLTWGACKYKVHKLHQRYILWWSLCTLYLPARQVRFTIGDSGLCCCTCVTYFECKLTPLLVDSARALWASFCFRFISFAQILSPPFICFVGEYLTQVFMWACEIKLVINPACCKPVHKIVSCSVNTSLLVI